MKKQIKNTLALYPTPLVVVGAMVDESPTGSWPAMSGLSAMTGL